MQLVVEVGTNEVLLHYALLMKTSVSVRVQTVFMLTSPMNPTNLEVKQTIARFGLRRTGRARKELFIPFILMAHGGQTTI